MNKVFDKARGFLYRNARPLDLTRFQYHFEGAGRDGVLKALACYQNPDGGFGHGLEEDCWNPHSAPVQTWAATEILREIGLTDPAHPIVQGILRYLASGQDFDGHFWYGSLKSNNDFPHAPWWHTDSDSNHGEDYNPTACLAGFAVRYAEKDSKLYRLGCRLTQEAFAQLMEGAHENDMHTTACYLRMLYYIKAAGAACLDTDALQNTLTRLVNDTLTKDPAEWERGYCCKPSQYFGSKTSVFYPAHQDLADRECDFILKTQRDDGSWDIPWAWSDYPEEWAVSKNWWGSNVILSNLLYLKGMGRF